MPAATDVVLIGVAGELLLTWAAPENEDSEGSQPRDYLITLERMDGDGSWVVISIDPIGPGQPLVWTRAATPGTYRVLVGAGPESSGEPVPSEPVVID